jgi:hypothetical protein
VGRGEVVGVGLIVPLVFVALCAVSFLVMSRMLRKMHETMRAIAAELGLSYRGPLEEAPPGAPADSLPPAGPRGFFRIMAPWRLIGNRSDVFVAIFPESRGKTSYTVVEAYYPEPLPFTMRIGRETALARMGKSLFGLSDIEVGSQRFDEEVRVKGSDPDRVAALLAHADVQERILAALQASPLVSVTERAARWERQGTPTKVEVFRGALDLVVPVAAAISRSGVFPA